MCKLEEQLSRPEEYERALIAIMLDHSVDGDMRGYAAQHLRSAWDSPLVDKKMIEAALFEGLNDFCSDVSGTALLALNDIFSKSGQSAHLKEVYSVAVNLANDESAHLPSRLTALSICADKKLKGTKKLAQKILSPGSSYDTTFKLVAKRILTGK